MRALGRLHVEVMDFMLDPLRHSYRAASRDGDTSELRKSELLLLPPDHVALFELMMFSHTRERWA